MSHGDVVVWLNKDGVMEAGARELSCMVLGKNVPPKCTVILMIRRSLCYIVRVYDWRSWMMVMMMMLEHAVSMDHITLRDAIDRGFSSIPKL